MDFPTNVTACEAKGVLRETDANGWKALIDHKDIPGYMEAMTMLIDRRDTNELKGLLPGDTIRFRMLAADSDGRIDCVQRLDGGTNAAVTTHSAALPIQSEPDEVTCEPTSELTAGDLLPDRMLTNPFGQEIRLSDFQGAEGAWILLHHTELFPKKTIADGGDVVAGTPRCASPPFRCARAHHFQETHGPTMGTVGPGAGAIADATACLPLARCGPERATLRLEPTARVPEPSDASSVDAAVYRAWQKEGH
ncbi:MAG TPA: copper-binding protein [Methylomirabilota bacterium]|nr:copper-binding protein [Methylomirabilota bacterium]